MSAPTSPWSLLPCLLVLLLFPSALVWGQSYVPQVPPFPGCPASQRLVTVGYPNATNHTLFQYPSDRIYGGYYVYVTPFTLRGQSAFGTVLHQLSLQLGDNRVLFAPTRFRLVVYLLQEAEKKINGFNEASMIAQTDELTLYPSAPQTVYADLLRPVLLESEGDYGLGVWADGPLILPGGRFSSGFSGIPQFQDLSYGYNDYSAPEGVILYAGDKIRPIAATGVLGQLVLHAAEPDFVLLLFPHRDVSHPSSHPYTPLDAAPRRPTDLGRHPLCLSAGTSASRCTTRTPRSPP